MLQQIDHLAQAPCGGHIIGREQAAHLLVEHEHHDRHEDQRQEEPGRRHPQKGHDIGDVVEQRVLMAGGVDPQREAGGKAHHQAEQAHQNGPAQALQNQRMHRSRHLERVAEVAAGDDVEHPGGIAHQDRAVEPVLHPQFPQRIELDLLLLLRHVQVGADARLVDADEVARRQVDHQKTDERQHQGHRQHVEQTPDDVARHGALEAVGASRPHRRLTTQQRSTFRTTATCASRCIDPSSAA